MTQPRFDADKRLPVSVHLVNGDVIEVKGSQQQIHTLMVQFRRWIDEGKNMVYTVGDKDTNHQIPMSAILYLTISDPAEPPQLGFRS